MISNVTANAPAAAASSVKRHGVGGATSDGDGVFKDVLEKSSEADAEPTPEELEAKDQESRAAFTVPRWHTVIGQLAEGNSSEQALPSDSQGDELVGADSSGAVSSLAVAMDNKVARNAFGQEGDFYGTGAAANSVNNASSGNHVVGGQNGAMSDMAAGLIRGEGQTSGANAARVVGPGEAAVGIAGHQMSEAAVSTGIPKAMKAGRGTENSTDIGKAGGLRSATSIGWEPGTGDVAVGDGTRSTASERSLDANIRIIGNARRDSENASTNFLKGAMQAENSVIGSPGSTGGVEFLQGSRETVAGRQVVDAVLRQLDELSSSRMSLNTGTSATGRTVKTMRLQLHPAELGAVNIRLQSAGGELQVSIRAESERTAHMLNNDSEAIRSALRAAGIAGADVIVTSNRNEGLQQQAFNAQNRDAARSEPGRQGRSPGGLE